MRYKAVEWAEHLDSQSEQSSTVTTLNKEGDVLAKSKKAYEKVVEEHQLESILGIARWDGEEKEREERRGIVYGLVVMGQGEGGILPVETIAIPGTGKLKLTGSLGDVRYIYLLS